jgi:hypothetical protein
MELERFISCKWKDGTPFASMVEWITRQQSPPKFSVGMKPTLSVEQ